MTKNPANNPATRHAEVDARMRPDEKPMGKADASARLRGGHQQVRGLRRASRR